MKTRIAREMITEHGVEIALMIAKADYQQAKDARDYDNTVHYAEIYQAINYIRYNK